MAKTRFDHFLFSDGNVRVRPGFLRCAVAPMANPRVGLVSNLFRAIGARSLGSRPGTAVHSGLTPDLPNSWGQR